MISQMVRHAIGPLLEAARLDGAWELVPIPGAANNQVFRVETPKARALLKVYFQHPDDPRDRLGAEIAFSRFAWGQGVRCVPQPLACDRSHQLGLYEFIEGRPFSASAEVTQDRVEAALDFFCQVNRARQAPQAAALPVASEAYFTLADHLDCVERRLASLHDLDDPSPVGQDAARFIRQELAEVWKDVRDDVGAVLTEPLPQHERCLSPSDFGFHNALLTAQDQVRFVDFEYAGWDDPAKMVCDFFCQPAVPVPLEFYDRVVDRITSEPGVAAPCRQRLAALWPVYQVKWCCLLLNDFLPVGGARRLFAKGDADPHARKAGQLLKARRLLQSRLLQGRS